MFWKWGNLGRRGERRAARFLRRRGLRILARNYTCPLGEIDLVCADGPTVVFVEVKTRSATRHGQPWQAVDARKRKKITRVAVYYLRHTHQTQRGVRFDVVAITWSGRWFSRPAIEYFHDAFSAEGPWSV